MSYVIHQLRNSVASVYSWSELLDRGLIATSTEVQDAHRVIHGESQRLTADLDDLSLHFRLRSNRQPHEPTPYTTSQIHELLVMHFESQLDVLSIDMPGPSSVPLSADSNNIKLLVISICSLIKTINRNQSNPDVILSFPASDQDVVVAIEMHGDKLDHPSANWLEDDLIPESCMSIPIQVLVGIRNAKHLLQLHGGSLEIHNQESQCQLIFRIPCLPLHS